MSHAVEATSRPKILGSCFGKEENLENLRKNESRDSYRFHILSRLGGCVIYSDLIGRLQSCERKSWLPDPPRGEWARRQRRRVPLPQIPPSRLEPSRISHARTNPRKNPPKLLAASDRCPHHPPSPSSSRPPSDRPIRTAHGRRDLASSPRLAPSGLLGQPQCAKS
jgi:hypothetical protein